MTGTAEKCEDCSLSKARQKNLEKETKERSSIPGERLFVDISSVKTESFGGSKFWLLVLDDASDYCWSYFLKKKSDLSLTVRGLIKDLKMKYKKRVKFIRCDNLVKIKCYKRMVSVKVWGFISNGLPQVHHNRMGVLRESSQRYLGVCVLCLSQQDLKQK